MPEGRYKELRSKMFPKNLLNDKMPKTKGNEEAGPHSMWLENGFLRLGKYESPCY